MKNSRLEIYLSSRGSLINKALQRWLPSKQKKPAVIHKAMRYSVNAGGKRLRPILVIAAAEACGGSANKVLPVACAMELIHTYSLIHDDLPAMDDDDLRRGLPTNHRVFGEDIAILAGDALLTQAFFLIARNSHVKGVNPRAVLEAIEIIAAGAGTEGMIGGQVADIQSDGGRWRKARIEHFSDPRELLHFIHENKTSALIQASLWAGGKLAGGNPTELAALSEYGKHIGLAFQIKDDILDRIGDKKKLGKSGSDKTNKKLTFPALYGLEKSKKMVDWHSDRALEALKPFSGRKSIILKEIAHYLLHRDH